MKKIMKKLTAALLALTCIPVTGLTVSAEGPDLPYYWGDTKWDAFEGYEPLDTHGMFNWVFRSEDSLVFLLEYPFSNSGGVVVANPRMDTMRFVLRDDVDASAAVEQMLEVLEEYFPELKDRQDTHDPERIKVSFGRHSWGDDDDRSYELIVPMSLFPEDAETLEAEILLAFAKRQLISEFYGFGETVDYATGGFDDDILAHLYTDHYEDNTDTHVDNDWDGIQDYLTEHYPGYMVEQYVEQTYTTTLEDGTKVEHPIYRHRIVPTEELTLREKLALMIELYDLFGIAPNCWFPDSAAENTLGHNALEQPGDVTLDCEIDIVDVIAANKAILGASTLCDTAQKNCDINGDGTPDTTDALAILKEVVGLTTNFAET